MRASHPPSGPDLQVLEVVRKAWVDLEARLAGSCGWARPAEVETKGA